MILWRSAAETRKHGADDLSGAGAAHSPGRWNDIGQPVLYTAPTIAIAVLWAAIPAGRVSVQAGADWLRGMTTAILEVPSVIVPEEPAALINPLHPDAKRMTARIVRLFEYNRLFRAT
jgi:RES domain-containing protein